MAKGVKQYVTYSDALESIRDLIPLYFYCGIANVSYEPYDTTYPTRVTLLNVDNTSAVKSATSAVTYNSAIGYYNDVRITLNNFIVHKKTTGNAWYPMAIAGKQYTNITNGECLPTYYCSGVTINPSQGKVKVKDLILVSGNTTISVSDLVIPPTPSTTTISMGTINGAFEQFGNSFSMSNVTMTFTTPYDSVTYNFGSGYAMQTLDRSANPSKYSLEVDDVGYPIYLTMSGTVNGQSIDYYNTIISGLVPQDTIYYSSGVDVGDSSVISTGIPSEQTVWIDFQN